MYRNKGFQYKTSNRMSYERTFYNNFENFQKMEFLINEMSFFENFQNYHRKFVNNSLDFKFYTVGY